MVKIYYTRDVELESVFDTYTEATGRTQINLYKVADGNIIPLAHFRAGLDDVPFEAIDDWWMENMGNEIDYELNEL